MAGLLVSCTFCISLPFLARTFVWLSNAGAKIVLALSWRPLAVAPLINIAYLQQGFVLLPLFVGSWWDSSI